MATFNIQLPNVRQLDWNDKRTQNILLDFFNELTEKLNYTLNNMDLTNFDRQTYVDLSKATTGQSAQEIMVEITEAEAHEREELFDTLKALIISTANQVTDEYYALFQSDDVMLQSVYQEVTNAIGDSGSLRDAWESSITQTAAGINITVGEVAEITSALNESVNGEGGLQEQLNAFKDSVETYMTFDFETTGMKIGKQGSQFDVVINNEQMSFRQGGTTVAYLSNNKLYITEAQITDKLTVTNGIYLGNFMFKVEDNNSLSIVKYK